MRKCLVIRKDERGVSPVIATILMVAITVVLAAVLYVMVTGLLSGPGATRPNVTFGAADPITNGFTFIVAGVSQVKAAANFKVNLLVNGSVPTAPAPTLVGTAMTFVVGAYTYTIQWTDVGGEGSLTGNDVFRVTRAAGPLPTRTDFVVTFLYTDGAGVGSRDFST